jgi:2-methylisocitrate lyase-like PEP mutase family enzyme
MHHGPKMLVLPNVWDAASACIFEDAGFAAIGTSSAAAAYSLGYRDGQRVPPEEMLAAIARIARAVAIPVTADVEAGYRDPIETARLVVEAGGVGINLEDVTGDGPDSLRPTAGQADLIARIRAATNLVINARTDIFLMGIGDPATRFDRPVERLNAYARAGADCLFAPGLRDADTFARLVRAVEGPVNILAVEGGPPLAELERMGVARVSLGSGPMRATLGFLRRSAADLLAGRADSLVGDGAIPYTEMNRLMEVSK